MKNLSNALQFALDNNRQIALAFGCFDILHIGHISFISKIRQITSLPLCIGILPDFVIASSKGCNRPIIIEEQRAEIISSLKNVDMAFVLEKSKRIDTLSKEYELTDKELPLWSTAMCWLDTLKPQEFFYSSDFIMESKIEKFLSDRKIHTNVIPYTEIISTSTILNRIKKAAISEFLTNNFEGGAFSI